MPEASSREVNGQIRAIFAGGAAGQLGDEQLLERFLAGRDGAAEAAFSALVERHGPMVLGVCRRVLGDRHEAEDAFQATFLVLARKAATVAMRQRLLPWLYKVALHTARESRDREARRRRRERRVGAMPPTEPPDPAEAGELAAILDEELARLPERYRSAVLLFELGGLSRREAAGRLGIPEATFAGRLARARARLRDALTRRGVAPAGTALSAALAREARAVVVPPALIEATTKAATSVAAGLPAAGLVSIPVATLTEGVLKAMLIAKLRGAALGIAALGLVAAGVTATSGQDGPDQGFGRGGSSGPVEERLESVERKLDRLLEALGKSVHVTPPPDGQAPQSPRDGQAPQSPLADLPDRPPSSPQPPFDIPPPETSPKITPPPGALPDSPPPPSGRNQPPDPGFVFTPNEPMPHEAGSMRASSGRHRQAPEVEPEQLASRITQIERRLDRLEQLYAAQERWQKKMERRWQEQSKVSEPPFEPGKPGPSGERQLGNQ